MIVLNIWQNVTEIRECVSRFAGILDGSVSNLSIVGVSYSRMRQLLAEGRVKGAERLGRDWVIPLPVEITPGARGPIGVAGERSTIPSTERFS